MVAPGKEPEYTCGDGPSLSHPPPPRHPSPSHNHTITQSHHHTITPSHNHTITQSTIKQSHRHTITPKHHHPESPPSYLYLSSFFVLVLSLKKQFSFLIYRPSLSLVISSSFFAFFSFTFAIAFSYFLLSPSHVEKTTDLFFIFFYLLSKSPPFPHTLPLSLRMPFILHTSLPLFVLSFALFFAILLS